MSKVKITAVDIKEREDGSNFAVVTYESLAGKATRISDSPEVAQDFLGQYIDADIKKCAVAPYKFTDADGNESMQSQRRVVKIGDESWDEAILASGHKLPAKTAVASEATAEEPVA